MICPSIHGSSGDMGAFLSMTLNPEAEELQLDHHTNIEKC